LLDHAARLFAEGLKAEFAKILKYLSEDNGFWSALGWVPKWWDTPYGVLEADSRSEGEFALNDIVLLKARPSNDSAWKARRAGVSFWPIASFRIDQLLWRTVLSLLPLNERHFA